MKKLLVAASALTVAAVRLFASTASVSDQVLTIALDADTAFSAVAAAHVDDLKANAITNITVTGAFRLTADTSIDGYTGTWTVADGSLYATVAKSLGTGKITMQSLGCLEFNVASATWENDVDFTNPGGVATVAAVSGQKVNLCFSKATTLNGDVTAVGNFAIDSRTFDSTINGEVNVPNGTVTSYCGGEGRTISYKGRVVMKKYTNAWNGSCAGGGAFFCAANAFGTLQAHYGEVYLNGVNVATNAVLQQGASENATERRGRLSINASQVIDRLTFPSTGAVSETTDKTSTEQRKHLMVFASGSTLTMRGTASDSSDVRLMGSGSFVWAPVDKSFTYTLDRSRPHTLQGGLGVTNGTLKVNGTATFAKLDWLNVMKDGTFDFDTTNGDDLTLPALTQITLGANAVVDFHGQLPFQPGSVTLRVQSTSKLKMKAGSYEIKCLFVDGQRADGTFTSENAAWLEEGVAIIAPEPDVPSVARTWDAGGGDDTRFSNPANWDGDTLPNFSDGSLLVTFAAGSAATVDVPANLKGIRFDAAFDLLPGEGGSMALGEDGLVLGTGVVSNAVPTRIDRDQTWTIPTGATLFQTGALQSKAGDAIRTLTRTGMGTLDLTGADAASTFAGSFAIRAGTMYVRGVEPFGAGRFDGLDRIDIQDKDGETKIWFCGMKTTKPVDEYVGNNKSACWETLASSTNEFAGRVKLSGTHRCKMGDKSVTVFSGGGTLTYVVFEGANNSDVIFREKPISLNGQWQSRPRVTSECTGSTVTMVLRHSDGGKITLKAPDALLGRASNGGYQYSNFISDYPESGIQQIELGGYSQTIGNWNMLPAQAVKNSLIENSSETPVDLHMAQSLESAMWITDFKGKINLFKETQSSITKVTAAVITNRAIEAVGTVNVVSGSLAFANDASWLGASNVTVAAGAKLSIAQSATFGKKAEIVLPDEAGAMTLGEGTTQAVRWITVGGTRLAVGYYGGPETTDPRVPAENKLAVFAGTGSVFVRGIPGVLLMVH